MFLMCLINVFCFSCTVFLSFSSFFCFLSIFLFSSFFLFLSPDRLRPDRPPPWLTREPENSKRAHFRAPALQTPKFHEKTPERWKKERNLWREKEKTRNFGPLPPFGGPRNPTFPTLHFSGAHPSGPQQTQPIVIMISITFMTKLQVTSFKLQLRLQCL